MEIEDAGTTVTFLGTGTSVGVPVIGCDCKVCTSLDPRNIRTRCALHVQSAHVSALIDTGPDLREQALREGLRVVDAVLYTHAHVDHVAGFDELRAFCWSRDEPLPLYAGPETHECLERMFPWAMKNTHRGYIRPEVRLVSGPFVLEDLLVTPVPVEHAKIETFGYRITVPGGNSFAYLPDVKRIPEASMALLEGLDVLIIDALRPRIHSTHMSIEESLAVVERLRPHQSIFTHLTHEVDFEHESALLPPGISFARDGLKLRFRDDSPCVMVEPAIAHAP